ncbi:MAG: histidine kinase [Deltaproteobacteria bacterium]|uniref:sensor histidine kinase n=1 Tax=Desulfobacula sp. TaxID=2593537 RepID=UPI00199101BF|nr:histidine kinase [Candidatus Desulfobacula maris]MBL6995285.1 histidine kinase [Desulfobacula sp.]
MNSFEYRKFTLGQFLRDIVYISLCSVLIALIFMLLTSEAFTFTAYIEYLLIAQCIGLSIGIPCSTLFHLLKPEKPFFQMALLTVCVVGGAILGSYIAGPLVHHKFSGLEGQISPQMIFIGVILGFIISFGFIAREQYLAFKLSANEEKLKRVSLEKEKMNADLKLLQAQVEPHFLFNTLSNILSLMDHEPQTGKKMLENLTQYLRTSLIQSRKPNNRLADEIYMIKTYLDIFKIRMGDRLSYRIDIPDQLLNFQIPPMILQPLVENAIKHGLEPKMDGGEIYITAFLEKEILTIEITDSGMGIQEKSATGVGTGNIKKRLKALYGAGAALHFEDITPYGLKATVEIPYASHHSHHRR